MIRQANKFDIPKIIAMLKNYRDASEIEHLKDADDEKYVLFLLTQIMSGMGVVFIAENDAVQGMLIAISLANIWSPKKKELKELAYWVEPAHRNTTVGYRLLKEYLDFAEDAKEKGLIDKYTVSKMFNSPDLKYDRFGFTKLEETWIK